VGHRTGLDVVEKKNLSCLYRDSSPGPSSPQPGRILIMLPLLFIYLYIHLFNDVVTGSDYLT
jgi:hypothetical protein